MSPTPVSLVQPRRPAPVRPSTSFDKAIPKARQRPPVAAPISHFDAPYPLSHNRFLLDYDVVDTLFLQTLHSRFTLYDFGQKPPERVLDLGTGSGMWILNAAKTWTNTSFVGFDLAAAQPSIKYIDPSLKTRIKWVHGNFLKPLPFPTNHFNLVRICRVGWGVPEQKWPDVIEDAVRVLKPGGVLEITEEDMIFPHVPVLTRYKPEVPSTCARSIKSAVPAAAPASPVIGSPTSPSAYAAVMQGVRHIASAAQSIRSARSQRSIQSSKSMAMSRSPPSSNARAPAPGSIRDSVTPAPPSGASLRAGKSVTNLSRQRSRSLTAQAESIMLGQAIPIAASSFAAAAPHLTKIPAHLPDLELRMETTPEWDADSIHPQDHSYIKAAFDAMLDKRFINSRPLSLIPFYLSQSLQNFQAHVPLQFVIPPSSSQRRRQARTQRGAKVDAYKLVGATHRSGTIQVDMLPCGRDGQAKLKSGRGKSRERTVRASAILINSGAEMHLARVLAQILACQDHLWEEFNHLNPDIGKKGFDHLLRNYELDMMDRIRIRDILTEGLKCTPPPDDSGALEEWHERLVSAGGESTLDTSVPIICRSLRGFVGTKPQ